jgi:serine/threonine protein kinase
VKVCDFGLSSTSAIHTTTRTTTGGVAGTLLYTAPELREGIPASLKKAPASDVYACSLVMFEIFTGWSPFCEPLEEGEEPVVLSEVGENGIAELADNVNKGVMLV